MTDTITILRARRGKRLAKFIRADGKIEDYDSVYRCDLIERQVADLDAVHRLLQHLLHRHDCCIVRGAPADPARVYDVRRLAHRCKKTGDEPTLRPAPHRWLAIDVDGLPRPDSVPATDLPNCAAVVVHQLPAAFHGARCIAMASASHGIKPGIRLRLWYWLDRLTTGAELKRWLRAAPIDPCLFRVAQITYTAAPVFAAGVSDHLPNRIVDLPGVPCVVVPSPEALMPPAPSVSPVMPKPVDAGAGRYAFAALTNAAARVQRAAIGHRHYAILNEARSLARFIDAGLLNKSDVMDTLRNAGIGVGKPADEIVAIIDWAMDNPVARALPDGVAP